MGRSSVDCGTRIGAGWHGGVSVLEKDEEAFEGEDVMLVRLRWYVLLFSVALLVKATAGAEVRQAVYTSEELRQRLKQSHDLLRAWSIEYQATSANLSFYNHRALAGVFPGGCFYRGAKGAASGLGEGVIDSAWKEDPFRDWVLVTSTHCFWGVPFNREYGKFPLPRDARLPEKVQTELMFMPWDDGRLRKGLVHNWRAAVPV